MHGKSWDHSSISLPLAVTCSLGRAGDRSSVRAFSPVCTQIAGKPQALHPQGVSSGGKAQGSSAADSQTIRLANAWAIYLISHGSVAAEEVLYCQIWQSYCQGLFHLIAVSRYWQTSISVYERCTLFYRVPNGSCSCSPEFDLAGYLI